MAKSPPEKTYRAGSCTVKVWLNPGTDRDFRTVMPERRYRDTDGQWHTTNSYPAGDLPTVIALMQKAFDYVLALDGTDPPDDES